MKGRSGGYDRKARKEEKREDDAEEHARERPGIHPGGGVDERCALAQRKRALHDHSKRDQDEGKPEQNAAELTGALVRMS